MSCCAWRCLGVGELKRHLKLIPVSLIFIALVALLSTVYDFIVNGAFTGRYLFHANFFFGAVLISIGCLLMFIPSSMLKKGDKLFDNTTFAERSFDARQRRQAIAMSILLIGILNIILTGLIQILLSILL